MRFATSALTVLLTGCSSTAGPARANPPRLAAGGPAARVSQTVNPCEESLVALAESSAIRASR